MDFVLEKPFRGLILKYFDNKDLTGDPKILSKSSSVNHEFHEYGPTYNFGKFNDFGLQWTGFIRAPKSGEYTFSTQAADGVKFWLNKKLLICC